MLKPYTLQAWAGGVSQNQPLQLSGLGRRSIDLTQFMTALAGRYVTVQETRLAVLRHAVSSRARTLRHVDCVNRPAPVARTDHAQSRRADQTRASTGLSTGQLLDAILVSHFLPAFQARDVAARRQQS